MISSSNRWEGESSCFFGVPKVRISTMLLAEFDERTGKSMPDAEALLAYRQIVGHELAHLQFRDSEKLKLGVVLLSALFPMLPPCKKFNALSMLCETRADIEGGRIAKLTPIQCAEAHDILTKRFKDYKKRQSYNYGYLTRPQRSDFCKRFPSFEDARDALIKEVLYEFCEMGKIKDRDAFIADVVKAFEA